MSDTSHPPTELQDLMSSSSNDKSMKDMPLPNTISSIPPTLEVSNIPQDSTNMESSIYQKSSKKNGFHWLKVFFVSILKLILVLIVGKLAWECNKSQTLLLRVFYTSFAVMFSELYIIYYAVYRTYLGNTCPIV